MVTYPQELLDRAQAYIEQPLTARRNDAGLAEISSLYSAITGQPIARCRQCQYADYHAIVIAYIREASHFLHPETMSDSKYTMAPGYQNEVFTHENYSQAVTAENLTDEAAEFFIKNGFGHAIVKKAAAVKADTEASAKAAAEKKAADKAAKEATEKAAKEVAEKKTAKEAAEKAAADAAKAQQVA